MHGLMIVRATLMISSLSAGANKSIGLDVSSASDIEAQINTNIILKSVGGCRRYAVLWLY